MLHPSVSAELARERQNDFLRQAEEHRRVRAARDAAPRTHARRRPVVVWEARRRRLGLVLVAWGTRLL